MRPLTGAERRLVDNHVDQVGFVASRMKIKLDDDSFQAGCLGLMLAATRFDPGRGLKFKTFAQHKIRGAILDFLRSDTGIVHISKYTWEKMTGSERLRWKCPVDVNTKIEHGDGVTEVGFDHDARRPVDPPTIDAEAVALAVENLPPRSAEILRLYYWSGLSMREVGRRVGLSEVRVSQIHADLLKRLREFHLIKMAVAV